MSPNDQQEGMITFSSSGDDCMEEVGVELGLEG